MAKSPNGKIVKLIYLKIAYVWTTPHGQSNFTANPGPAIKIYLTTMDEK